MLPRLAQHFFARSWCAFLVLLVGCEKRGAAPSVAPRVALETLLRHSTSAVIPLADADRIQVPVAGAVLGGTMYVVDQKAANIKAIALTAETIGLTTLGGPGDRNGQLRRPVAIALVDSTRFAILDQARGIVAIHDTRAVAIREIEIPAGFLHSILPMPTSRRLLAIGQLHGRDGAVPQGDLHELGVDGRLIRSFAPSRPPANQWRQRFAATFGTLIGASALVGSMNADSVRLINLYTGDTKALALNVPWPPPPQWPSNPSRFSLRTGVAPEAVRTWMYRQRFLNGLFPLADGKVLARFLSFDSGGVPKFYYAIADTLGRTLAVTYPTRMQVLATAGDTVFWLRSHSQSLVSSGSAVLHYHGVTANGIASSH